MDLEEIPAIIQKFPSNQQSALAKWLGVPLARRAREQEHVAIEAKIDARNPDRRVSFKSTALRWTVLSLLAFLVVEAAVFRTGWYNQYLEPGSSAGMVEYNLYWLSHAPPASVPEVMVLGDSRIAQGLSTQQADARIGNRIHFWNFGLAGTTPRIWYYILRDADPTRRRFKAIVVALDHYADEDSFDSSPDRLIDLNFLVGRLRLTDCEDFASSMKTRAFQERALAGCLFKGIPLRRDVQDFLLHVRDRIKRSTDYRKNGLFDATAYSGHEGDLDGLSADFESRTLVFPPGVEGARRASIQAMLLPVPAPQTGETSRYRQLWLGRILDFYKDSPTQIVFLQMAATPLPTPPSREPARFLQSAIQHPRVSAVPPETFRDLQRPELFFDGLHLNKTGRKLFSARIAETILPILGMQ